MKKLHVWILLVLFSLPLSVSAADINKGAGAASPFSYDIALSLGYVNHPDYQNMYAFSLFLLGKGMGYYGSLKSNTIFSRLNVGNYYSDKDIADVTASSEIRDRFKEASIFNLGLTWSFNDYASIYGGVGFAGNNAYVELYGPVAKPGEPAFNQTYYVNDEKNSQSTIEADYGLLLTFGSLFIQLGRNNELGLGLNLNF